jgi:AcrR family transcriptional regulator
MSLYNHVANKDALLDGMVDVVFGEIGVAFAEAEGWQAQMRARAEAAHATLMRHPWAAMLFMSRINVGPCALCYVDTTLRCLRGAGFSWPAADHAWNALDAFVYGFTLQQLAFPFQPDEYAGAAEDFLPQLPPDAYPDLVALSREVMAGRHDGLHSLSFGLELILAGLEGLRGRLGSVELGPRISTTC